MRYRIRPGVKVPGDLVLDAWTGNHWQPVPMTAALFLVDFFTENEDLIAQYRPHWRRNGDTNFLLALPAARKLGWREAAIRAGLRP